MVDSNVHRSRGVVFPFHAPVVPLAQNLRPCSPDHCRVPGLWMMRAERVWRLFCQEYQWMKSKSCRKWVSGFQEKVNRSSPTLSRTRVLVSGLVLIPSHLKVARLLHHRFPPRIPKKSPLLRGKLLLPFRRSHHTRICWPCNGICHQL